MTLTNLQKAEQERSALEASVNVVEIMLNGHSAAPLSEATLKTLDDELTQAQLDLREINKKIYLCVPTDLEPHTRAYQSLYVKIVTLLGQLGTIKARLPRATAGVTGAPPVNNEVKLPKLELPQFNGDPTTWASFRDMFTAAVDKKSSLSKVEKLTYLKTLVVGEASRLVQNYSLTEANYDAAWQALVDRYENEREQMFAVLKKFFTQHQVSSSSTSIRNLLDTTRGCIRTFTSLKGTTDHLFIYTLFSKLDNSTRELWFQKNEATKIPSLDDLYKFLEQRALGLSAGNPSSSSSFRKGGDNKVQAHHVQVDSQCSLSSCGEHHKLYKCPEFLKLTVQQRSEHVKQKKLCYNCLGGGHSSSECRSNSVCRNCKKKHNSLLHYNRSSQTQKSESSESSVSAHSHHGVSIPQTLTSLPARLLATAVIKTVINNQTFIMRALIDPGSSHCFVTRSTVSKMCLEVVTASANIIGIQSSSGGCASGLTQFAIMDDDDNETQVSALVVNQITTKLPLHQVEKGNWSHLEGLKLADPHYHTPGKIDVLLGTDVFWYILKNGIRKRGPNEPVGVNTTLGWLVGGNISPEEIGVTNCFLTNSELNFTLEKFFMSETAPASVVPELTLEEKECEEHFVRTVQRINGRFLTPIPWKKGAPPLGESRQMAVKRLHSLERRLQSENYKQYKPEYDKFMDEYLQLGHMSRVPVEEVIRPLNPVYYIPHHFVLKPDSTTTKLRVVFDASARTTTNYSLNDLMLIGPVVQSSLFEIVLRFRIHPVAFTADITKMYRNIGIPYKDSDLHRILWRKNPAAAIEEFRLNTVTYGTGAAPYVATRCLKKLADDEETKFPVAAPILRRDFYVDDLQSGQDTPKKAKVAIRELIQICATAGMELRKWTCNKREVLETIPVELREQKELIPIDDDSTVKTLGIHWHPAEDNYRFKINLPTSLEKYTKRIVASEMAKIFDPVGWLAPVTVKGKLILQELWKLKEDWDTSLPSNLQQQWKDYRESLQHLEKIKIPRFILPKTETVHLVGFGDSSLKAYSAVVYLYCQTGRDEPVVSLVTSKTRVASLNAPTLPRLELNAAALLAELMTTVEKALCLEFNSKRAYSDSTITLCWIRSNLNLWKQYVRNRVIKIQTHVPASNWFHVPGESNPADCASRGLLAEELVNYDLWFKGNVQIFNETSEPPLIDISEMKKEERPQEIICNTIGVDIIMSVLKQFSSLTKLKIFVALLLRAQENFIKRKEKLEVISGSFSAQELEVALLSIIKYVQTSVFTAEKTLLGKGQQLPTSSILLPLTPVVDAHGVLRVGGRLRHAKINTAIKHPIILPRHHHLTTLIIRDHHIRNFHAGQQSTLSSVMQRFWIIRGRDAVRHEIRKCVQCARQRGECLKQIMGDLPAARVNPAPCFQKCGVDFAGPFTAKNCGRSKIQFKAYLVIFVCFATKAIHLEIATSLSTDNFIAAFRRFVSRRGKPSDVHSDNGTNFRGAQSELYQLQDQMKDACAEDNIRWHFNPPGAPHFGGLWEAGVKSVKYHLKRVMGSSVLTYEELYTLIEAILNSRPLTPISSDPNDLEVLTPAHFLIGRPLTSAPDHDYTDINVGRLDRWQLLQQKMQIFWNRWHKEYISRMQQRPKWMKVCNQIKVNDVVIIKEENTPPAKWRLGRVIDTHPGDDGNIRVVTLKTQNGITEKLIHKLCVLPVNE